MRFRSCFLLGLFVISVILTSLPLVCSAEDSDTPFKVTNLRGQPISMKINDTWLYMYIGYTLYPNDTGWIRLENITILKDGIYNLNYSLKPDGGIYQVTDDYCPEFNWNMSITISFPNGTVVTHFLNKGKCDVWHPYITKRYYPYFANVLLPKGTTITLAVNFPHSAENTYFYAHLVKSVTVSTTTTTVLPPPPPPPQTPITNVALPSWSKTWIDNNTIMIRLSVSWGTAYKISVLNENGTEIPFYASINGWYNGSNAEYTTADCKALTLWRANITYNGETVEGLVIKAGDSAPINLVLEPYPNEFYDYAIFIHLEGTWEKAVPVVTTSSLPSGGVLDWLTGAFRWLHDALLGTPLKPLVQAFDMLAGIGWGLYNVGKTIVGIVWSVIQVGAKVFPYLGFAILLSFIVLLITRPLDTIHMIMDMIEWIKKTIGAIVEFVAMIAG